LVLKFSSRFESVGRSLPDKIVTTEDLMKTCRKKVKLDLEDITGIHERRVASEDEDSFTLARDAALDCLEHSDYKPEDLEMVINCSISKFHGGLTHRFEPPMSVSVANAIGAGKAITFDIGNACAGMMTGVFILDDFIRRGMVKNGMVVSGEFITHISTTAAREVKTIASKQMASLTVGDAGSATILERTEEGHPGIAVSEFCTLAKYSRLCIGKPSKTGPGGMMKTQARKIHRVAIADSPPILKNALDRSGLSFDQIDHVIPHQTSVRSIKSGAKRISARLGVKPKNVVVNLYHYGNTASTTHFVALYELLEKREFKKGENVMLICFASGLVVGVVIFEMDELVEKYGSKD
jgi:3-oxoacyl-[acyl-carrier-protein] synthase-3